MHIERARGDDASTAADTLDCACVAPYSTRDPWHTVFSIKQKLQSQIWYNAAE
jgi:hypothetical protein